MLKGKIRILNSLAKIWYVAQVLPIAQDVVAASREISILPAVP